MNPLPSWILTLRIPLLLTILVLLTNGCTIIEGNYTVPVFDGVVADKSTNMHISDVIVTIYWEVELHGGSYHGGGRKVLYWMDETKTDADGYFAFPEWIITINKQPDRYRTLTPFLTFAHDDYGIPFIHDEFRLLLDEKVRIYRPRDPDTRSFYPAEVPVNRVFLEPTSIEEMLKAKDAYISISQRKIDGFLWGQTCGLNRIPMTVKKLVEWGRKYHTRKDYTEFLSDDEVAYLKMCDNYQGGL